MSSEILWLGWLVMFVFYELIAAKQHKGGTLSETAWRWFAVKGGKAKLIRQAVLFAFMSSLTIHLVWATTVRYVVATGIALMATIGLSTWLERKR